MTKLNKNPIIIDTDPGIDDAIALAIALLNDKIKIDLLTSIAGNVKLEHTTNNTLRLVEFFKSFVPVARGASEPLLKEFKDASEIHGETGLAGYEFPPIETDLHEKNAIDAMREVILSSDEKTTIIALGPLTNIALLIKTYPEVKEKIKEIIFMGGGLVQGNVSSTSEFNIYVDPHAAEIVFRSELPLVMLGLDVTSKALITEKEIDQIRERGALGDMLYSLFSYYQSGTMKDGLLMHDACTLAYLLEPTLFETELLHVETVLDGPAVGATVTNFSEPDTHSKNVLVAREIKGKEFKEWITEELLQATDRLEELSE